MQAKKCDRCHRFYDYIPYNRGKLSLTNYSNTPSQYLKRVDLCESCEASLVAWFEEYKGEKE